MVSLLIFIRQFCGISGGASRSHTFIRTECGNRPGSRLPGRSGWQCCRIETSERQALAAALREFLKNPGHLQGLFQRPLLHGAPPEHRRGEFLEFIVVSQQEKPFVIQLPEGEFGFPNGRGLFGPAPEKVRFVSV